MNKLFLFLFNVYSQLKKYWKYVQYLLIFIIWVAVLGFVYYQKEKFLQILTNTNIEWKFIFFALLLLFFNLGLEALKWSIKMNFFEYRIGFWESYLAILIGNATAFITPQKLGDYLGRLLILKPENRITGIVITFYDRISQLGITLLLGSWALASLSILYFPNFVLFSIILLLFHGWLWGLPLFLPSLSQHFPSLQFLKEIFSKIPGEYLFLTSNLSFFRYLTFLTQYLLLFKSMGVYQENLWALCSLVFLIKSFIPSIALSELGIREGIAVWVFSQFSNIDHIIVFQVTFILFIINTLIPTAIGAFFFQKTQI